MCEVVRRPDVKLQVNNNSCRGRGLRPGPGPERGAMIAGNGGWCGEGWDGSIVPWLAAAIMNGTVLARVKTLNMGYIREILWTFNPQRACYMSYLMRSRQKCIFLALKEDMVKMSLWLWALFTQISNLLSVNLYDDTTNKLLNAYKTQANSFCNQYLWYLQCKRSCSALSCQSDRVLNIWQSLMEWESYQIVWHLPG